MLANSQADASSVKQFPIQRRSLAEIEGHPPCSICGCPVTRREREKPSDWHKRQTCSQQCKEDLLSRRLQRDPTKAATSRTEHARCTVCRGPVERRDGEQRGVWLGRRTCSKACLIASHRHDQETSEWSRRRRAEAMNYDHPPCVVCRAPIEIRVGEVPCYWRRRKTCSRACLRRLRDTMRGVHRSHYRDDTATHAAPERPAGHKPTASHPMRRPQIRRYAAGGPGAVFETVEQARARGVEVKVLAPAYAAPTTAAVA